MAASLRARFLSMSLFKAASHSSTSDNASAMARCSRSGGQGTGMSESGRS